MRIGAFIFLFGVLANLVNIAGDINAHNYQRLPADNQIKAQNQSLSLGPEQAGSILMKSFVKLSGAQTAGWFREDLAKKFMTAQDTSNTDNSDSSDDQRGSGRIDASLIFSPKV